MNEKQAHFIIQLTVSTWLPTVIGRRRFWHSLYYRAAEVMWQRQFRLTRRPTDAADGTADA